MFNLWKMSRKRKSQKSRRKFVAALGIRGAWNEFDKSAYDNVLYFNNKTLKYNEISIKWSPSCYPTFTSSKNLSFFKFNQMRKARAFQMKLTEHLHAHKNHLKI